MKLRFAPGGDGDKKRGSEIEKRDIVGSVKGKQSYLSLRLFLLLK